MRVLKWLVRGARFPYKWSLIVGGVCAHSGEAQDSFARELQINKAKASIK